MFLAMLAAILWIKPSHAAVTTIVRCGVVRSIGSEGWYQQARRSTLIRHADHG
jgi:hypothetical protein